MTRTAAGRFAKGVSGNPSGKPHTYEPVSKAAPAPGISGVVSFSGVVSSGERSSDMTGSQKWVTYSNSYNTPVIATGLRYFGNLLAGTSWTVEENPAGGRDAIRGKEIIEQGLIHSPMLKPWPQIVRKAAMYRPLGFSLHATAMRRRKDGMIVYAEIEHRPQHTIEKWLRPNNDEGKPFDTVIQRSRQSGKELPIPLDECFYCVDDTLTDNPEGVGLLRHVIEHVRRLGVLEKMEGSALVRDMGGTPVGRAPIAEIIAQLGPDATDTTAKVATAVATLRRVMENRNKTPEEAMYLLLDSSTYRNPDGTPTGVLKWALEIVRSETANMAQADVTIRRVELQIARVLGIEFALMGGDGKGSYAQHEDKTSMFASNLQTTLNELGWSATMQLGRKLVARNGLDPDTACPRLIAEPISTEAVLTATQALANLNIAGAGLPQEWEGFDVVLSRLRLPPRPEVDLRAPRVEVPEPVDAPDDGDPTGADGTEKTPTEAATIDEAVTTKRKPGFAVGDRVVSLAEHMEDMKGMAGEVVIARAGSPPYYGVRFDDQKAMPGVHKWLAEDELSDETEGM